MRRGAAEGPVDQAQLQAALRRIEEQFQQARANEGALREQVQRNEGLKAMLNELSDKLEHSVMVPYGPLAFFRGKLVHTNEITHQIGAGYWVEQTTKGAVKAVDRRLARLKKNTALAAQDIAEVGQRRKVAAQEAGVALPEEKFVPAPADAPAGTTVRLDDDGHMDIREPVEGDAQQVRMAHAPSVSVVAEDEDPWTSALARLRKLEEQEEEEPEEPEEQEDDGCDNDELAGLDKLMEAYEQEPGTCSASDEASAVQAPSPQDASVIRSPADVYAMMRDRTDAEEASEPPLPQAQSPAASRAFTGSVLERRSPEASRSDEPAADAQPAPKRVSKFKSERLQRRQ